MRVAFIALVSLVLSTWLPPPPAAAAAAVSHRPQPPQRHRHLLQHAHSASFTQRSHQRRRAENDVPVDDVAHRDDGFEAEWSDPSFQVGRDCQILTFSPSTRILQFEASFLYVGAASYTPAFEPSCLWSRAESYDVASNICQAMLPGRRRGGIPSARDAERLRLRGSGCGMAREERRASVERRAGERDDRGGGVPGRLRGWLRVALADAVGPGTFSSCLPRRGMHSNDLDKPS
jgi:hypothetical protein